MHICTPGPCMDGVMCDSVTVLGMQDGVRTTYKRGTGKGIYREVYPPRYHGREAYTHQGASSGVIPGFSPSSLSSG